MNFLFIASTIDQDLGGIARSVPALAAGVASQHSVTLIAPSSERDTLATIRELNTLRLLQCDGIVGVQNQLLRELYSFSLKPILCHAGVWNSLNHFVASTGRRRNLPVIVSTRSMLDPWALRHHRFRKLLAWWLYARWDLLSATAIHATAEMEAGFIRKALGKKCPPVFVVPNGVGLPGEEEATKYTKGTKDAKDADGLKRILFLSRIHEKKGVLDLIYAFGHLNPEGWELVIAGNDDGGHLAVCQDYASHQPNAERIRFTGPVDDTAKWDLYSSADLFVLPSYSENFGIVVGEALGMGIPVITTSATPWSEYAENLKLKLNLKLNPNLRLHPKLIPFLAVTPGSQTLTTALRKFIALPEEERSAMGESGRQWIRRDFQWPAIGKQFIAEVEKVLTPR